MLRVGTDCSGIEAPIIALKQLKIPFSHEFSSEIDKHCIESIKANYKPKKIFGDMKKRKVKDIPDIDLYICGFPCQPFSMAGERKGTEDTRGTIFYECLKVIKNKKPNYFILENVKGLITIDEGNTFKEILQSLKELKIYNVEWKILNTKDYGIPQNRERVFIVGIKKSLKKEFHWPRKKKLESLKKYVDWKDTRKDELTENYKRHLEIVNPDSYFIDFSFSKYKYPFADRYSPCLITSITYFNKKLMRKANIYEYLKLQGFPISFKQVVSDNQLKKQIGNSMSVNVLKELFKCIF